MKARFDVSGIYGTDVYDASEDQYEIDYELAKCLNIVDFIYFIGRDGEECEAKICYKWADLIDGILVLNCEC